MVCQDAGGRRDAAQPVRCLAADLGSFDQLQGWFVYSETRHDQATRVSLRSTQATCCRLKDGHYKVAQVFLHASRASYLKPQGHDPRQR